MSDRKSVLLSLAASAVLALGSAAHAGLIAYYTFDDATNLGKDSSGNGYDLTAGGTTNGGPAQLTGASAKVGTGAVAFDGVDDVFTRPGKDIYPNVSAISISFWVQTSDSTNANNSKNISRESGSATGLNIFTGGTPTATYRVNPSSGTGLNSGVIESNTWRSVVITFSGGTTTMYVDGVQKASSTGTTYTSVTSSTDFFGLGARAGSAAGTGGSGTFFLGNIDDFAVYNTALSASTAAGLANGTLTPQTVPEPAAMGFIGTGVALVLRRRRR